MSLQVFQEFSFYLITSPLPQTNIHASTEKNYKINFHKNQLSSLGTYQVNVVALVNFIAIL